ncbi:hypothetical protein MKX08_009441 [Trichoderma sp. CBMAI-0020]|nr:hypothetical protein MKX08_009441 [Trichoderma sp. CBMAI-0020]
MVMTMMMMMMMMVDNGERAARVRVSTELRATWWQLRLTCAQPALGFAHDALSNRHRKPAGSQKHAQKTCQQALEKSQRAAVSWRRGGALRQDMDQHQRMDVTPDASGTGRHPLAGAQENVMPAVKEIS